MQLKEAQLAELEIRIHKYSCKNYQLISNSSKLKTKCNFSEEHPC